MLSSDGADCSMVRQNEGMAVEIDGGEVPGDWQARLTETVAAQIRHHREAKRPRKWSAERLSTECAQLGYPIPRAVISNLENGARESVSLAELLVLAAALDVPPASLLFPVGHSEDVEALPDQRWSTIEAYLWLIGEGIDRGASYRAESILIAAEREHAELVARILDADRGLAVAAAPGGEPSAAMDDLGRQLSSDLIVLNQIRSSRHLLIESGVPATMPALPARVAELLDQMPRSGRDRVTRDAIWSRLQPALLPGVRTLHEPADRS